MKNLKYILIHKGPNLFLNGWFFLSHQKGNLFDQIFSWYITVKTINFRFVHWLISSLVCSIHFRKHTLGRMYPPFQNLLLENGGFQVLFVVESQVVDWIYSLISVLNAILIKMNWIRKLKTPKCILTKTCILKRPISKQDRMAFIVFFRF